MQELQVQLKTTAVLDIPLHVYDQDFTFIVNDKEYTTSRVVSDLLSPYISQMHQTDPTLSTFIINTEEKGDFNHFLDLVTFTTHSIPTNEFLFFSEVIEKLGNVSIGIDNIQSNSLTNDNVIELLHRHEQFHHLYGKQIEQEIEYVSSHFYEICDRFFNELKTLSINTIEKVVSNVNLKLLSEDQLLKFANDLYQDSTHPNRREYSIVYEHVLFDNVGQENISEFVDHFNKDDMSEETWRRLSSRLKGTINNGQTNQPERYKKCEELKTFLPKGDSNFDGIFKYLVDESNSDISEKVGLTASSHQENIKNVTQYNTNNWYGSNNEQNSWICFDFKDKRIIPTNYQIKSCDYDSSWAHPKSWIIEGLNDNGQWENLSTVNDCSYLNGRCLSHIFQVTNPNQKKFSRIRLTQTGKTWFPNDCLSINCFELYGKLMSQ